MKRGLGSSLSKSFTSRFRMIVGTKLMQHTNRLRRIATVQYHRPVVRTIAMMKEGFFPLAFALCCSFSHSTL